MTDFWGASMIGSKSVLNVGIAWGAILAAVPAQAQQVPPVTEQPQSDAAPNNSSTDEGGDIVVTAQKRAQRLLDVPVPMTAISADNLSTQNVVRIADIYEKVPGIQYSGQRVSSLALRGITTGGATSPTVALLLDDVQFGGTTNAGQPPLPDFDPSALERVEVLRGPQGTLYGASSLGGLIKYVLKQPDTRALSGRVEVGGTAVSHGGEGYAVRGSLNVPLTDWLAVSGSGFKREDAPYLDNASTNPLVTDRTDVNTREAWGFRGAVLVRPTGNLTLNFSALQQKQDARNSDLAITAGGVPICAACYGTTTIPRQRTARITFDPVFGDLTINSVDSINSAKFQLYTGRAELDLGAAQVTSISAWSRADNIITSDVTNVFSFLRSPGLYNVPGGTVQIANSDYTRKFSQELRIGGTGAQFDWLVGGFYTVEHVGTNQTLLVRNASAALVNTPYVGEGPSTYREYAGFGDLTWHVTDRLDLQVGGRYARNTQDSANILTLDPKVVGIFGVNGGIPFNSKDSVFTWLVSPSYHVSNDILAYARVASGYRPGGPNLDASGVGAFGPDRVVNYEVGFKGKVIPDLLVIDASIFQIDWTKIQLQGTASNNFTFITNGGEARSRGVEVQASLNPWRGMALDGNMTVTDAEITQALPGLNASSLSAPTGSRLPFSSRFSANLSAQQTFTVKNGLQATLGFTFTHVGNRAGPFNTVAGNGGHPRILIPAYQTIGVNAGATINDVWSITAYVRNLLDERGVAAADSRSGTNVPTALFIQPATMGLTLARKF